jgi:hypothetical protein
MLPRSAAKAVPMADAAPRAPFESGQGDPVTTWAFPGSMRPSPSPLPWEQTKGTRIKYRVWKCRTLWAHGGCEEVINEFDS